MAIDRQVAPAPARVPLYNDPKVRSIAYQVALFAVVGLLIYGAASNAISRLNSGVSRACRTSAAGTPNCFKSAIGR